MDVFISESVPTLVSTQDYRIYTTQIYKTRYVKNSRDWKIKAGKYQAKAMMSLSTMYTVMDRIFVREGSKFLKLLSGQRVKQDSQ